MLITGVEETAEQEPQDGDLPVDGETKLGEELDTAEQDYLELEEEVPVLVVTATTTKLNLTACLEEAVKEELFGILTASSLVVVAEVEEIQQHGVVQDHML